MRARPSARPSRPPAAHGSRSGPLSAHEDAGSRRTLDRAVSEQVADVMFALSAPSRVQILSCLLDGAHAVSELVARLEVEQSAVSHQLRVLRDHSLVRVERQGRRRLYTLADEYVVALLGDAIRHVEQRRTLRLRPRGGLLGNAAAGPRD